MGGSHTEDLRKGIVFTGNIVTCNMLWVQPWLCNMLFFDNTRVRPSKYKQSNLYCGKNIRAMFNGI